MPISTSTIVTNTTPLHVPESETKDNNSYNNAVKDKEMLQREKRRQQDAELAAEVLAELAGDSGNSEVGNTINGGGITNHSSSVAINSKSKTDIAYAEFSVDDDELELSDLDELLKGVMEDDGDLNDNDYGEGTTTIKKKTSANKVTISNHSNLADDDLDLLEDIVKSSTSKNSSST